MIISSILLLTVIAPAALGVLLAIADLVRRRSAAVVNLAWLLALLAVFWLHEGLPPFPPVAAKQKLFYVIVALALLASFARSLNGRKSAVAFALLLSAAFVWLGINKLGGGAAPATFVPVTAVATLMIGVASFFTPDSGKHAGFAAPLAILAMAVGGAGLALAGAFIGAAQLLGGIAALLGGYLAVRYLLLLPGRSPAPAVLAADTIWFLLAVVVAMLLLTSLLAPTISLAAMALVALTPAAAAAAPSWRSVAEPIRPLLSGVTSALPAAAAILLALWQPGAHAAN